MEGQASPRRVIVGLTGASGARLGIRMLQALRSLEIESHLVVSKAAQTSILKETDWALEAVRDLAAYTYEPDQIGAQIASGSFTTAGMAIVPCSIKTLSAVANAYANDLIVRAADVTLKEGRPLILVVRETPLHVGHLRLMSLAAEAGAVIFPPVPPFYSGVQTLDEIVDQIVGRVLLRMGIPNPLYRAWEG